MHLSSSPPWRVAPDIFAVLESKTIFFKLKLVFMVTIVCVETILMKHSDFSNFTSNGLLSQEPEFVASST